jgi:hypothetical protein
MTPLLYMTLLLYRQTELILTVIGILLLLLLLLPIEVQA